MDKKMVPEVRFKGFSDDWEQHKLGSITVQVSGNDGRQDLPILTISAKNGWMTQSDRFSKILAGHEKKKYTLLKKNEISYNHGNSKYAPYGAVFSLKTFNEALVPRIYHSFRVKDGYSSDFIESLFATHLMDRQLRKIITSGARMDGLLNISYSNFMKINTCLPSEHEQKQISNLLIKLSEMIALQQEQLDLYKKLKKGLLQKLFPKDGKRVPEIRFADFTGNWEQHKITEIAKIFIGLVTSMTTNYRDSGTLLIRNSDIKNGRFEFSDHPIYLDETFAEDNKTRRLHLNDIVTVHTGDIGTSAVIGEKEEGAIGFATINTRPNINNVNPQFLSTYFNSNEHKRWALRMSTGDGRSNYNLYDFKRLTIPTPSIPEQRQIGQILTEIENLIVLKYNELSKLKLLNRYLLQKLFI